MEAGRDGSQRKDGFSLLMQQQATCSRKKVVAWAWKCAAIAASLHSLKRRENAERICSEVTLLPAKKIENK
jgi:hypothetical protein